MKNFMDYPNNVNVKHYDGKKHQIEPLNLQEMVLRGKKMFLLEYNDILLNTQEMVTLLEERNGVFFNVPLKEYDNRFQYLLYLFDKNGNSKDLDILPSHILTRKIPVDLGAYIDEVSYASRVEFEIFYNLADNKYYWDKNCEFEVVGAPRSLGSLSNNRAMIIGKGDYIIRNIYKKKEIVNIYYDNLDGKYYSDNHGVNEITITGQKADNIIHTDGKIDYNVFPITKSTINEFVYIFYNSADGLYYYDVSCTQKIENAPSCLGEMSKDGRYIIGSL